MADHLSDWAAARKARVIRLVVEERNEPARHQVERSGFRAVGDWVRATRSIGEASPVPAGNGGRRVPATEQLVPANGFFHVVGLFLVGELGRVDTDHGQFVGVFLFQFPQLRKYMGAVDSTVGPEV